MFWMYGWGARVLDDRVVPPSNAIFAVEKTRPKWEDPTTRVVVENPRTDATLT